MSIRVAMESSDGIKHFKIVDAYLIKIQDLYNCILSEYQYRWWHFDGFENTSVMNNL